MTERENTKSRSREENRRSRERRPLDMRSRVLAGDDPRRAGDRVGHRQSWSPESPQRQLRRLVGFVILTTVAFAATLATIAVEHLHSLTASLTGKRIAFSGAWLTALVVGTLGVFLATEMLGFFFILSFFEGLF